MDNDARTFLKSPTAGIWNSSLKIPVDLPSSDTVTTAVMSRGNSFNPFNKTDNPVPPPRITTFFRISPFLSILYYK